MSVLISILAIIAMIIVHEWGHFIAGRICKIPIYEFSIGFGPRLFKKRNEKKGTDFSIRAIPLGGYCAFDDISDSANINGVTDTALDKLPFGKRAFICAAGPIMNFIFAFIITFCVCLFAGGSYNTTEIIDFTENSAISNVFNVGDTITELNGVDVKDNEKKMTQFLSDFKGGSLNVTVIDKNGNKIEKEVTPNYNKETGRYALGFYMGNKTAPESLFKAIPDSLKETGSYFYNVVDGFVGLFNGKYKMDELTGIVGAVSTMSEYATKNTILSFLSLVCFISVDLGIMNLLPIPPLDGFKIVSGFYEIIFKRKPNDNIMTKVSIASFFVIIAFSVFLIIKDVIRII